ncbi:HNH endonuclease [Sphingomonas sp.]|uniref:HNH endonuclease n=1 Tax=Sphingomonas sp. TaxID=28214 RepID=UPI003B0004AF
MIDESDAEQQARIKQAEIDTAWTNRESPIPTVLRRREWLAYHLRRQNDLCFYCAVKMEAGALLTRPTLDHCIPRSRGGEDSRENTVAACILCNIAKGDMMPDEVRSLLPVARVRVLNRLDKRAEWRRDRPRRL